VSRRFLLSLLRWFAAIGVLAASRTAAADDGTPCGQDTRPWVQIVGEAPSLSSAPGFVPLLRAELASRGIDLCTTEAASGAAPIATVLVTPRPDGVTLTVEVRDALTEKQVRRDVALSSVPADGRPLTVALAADELLRASWAELALRSAPPSSRPVPPQVVEAVHDALPAAPRARPSVQLGVGFVWEQYARGMTLYGADARLGGWLTRRLELAMQLGLRTAPTTATADGTVQPTAWSASAVALFTFTPPESQWGLDAVASFGVERLTFVPTPLGAATGSQQSGYALLASLGPQGWFAIVPALRIGAEVLAIAPLRGVEAADAGTPFVGANGLGWTMQLGLWSAL
jgi:hypothetical protein